MRAHVLQHVPFEGLGSIEPWLREKNAQVGWTKFYEDESLPKLSEVDFVIALGGPMSVNDPLSWIAAEKKFLGEAIMAGKGVLGICLGAQLMASSLGAKVYPAPQKEIGWFALESVAGNLLPKKFEAFQWHGETFDLPRGATHLARSEACEHQAFRMGPRAVALQFHLETTPESADALIQNCREELVAGPFIQSESALRSTPPDRYAKINVLMAEILEGLG
ncbi:MAG: amidotransferase [Verrucomicrobiae bacterium]|nr:amidotransferase [Verrucomicrobiae bacterium]